jgi:histidinol-phosphatase (PHP family)
MIDFTKDSHIHTCYSPDADLEATFQSYITRALELGLTELTFTDHVDIDAAHPLFSELIDYDNYINVFRLVQKKAPIPIKLGVEIGYQSHVKDEIQSFLNRYDFDFVILSIHYIEQKDLYTQEYFEGKSKEDAYRIYFETILDAVTSIDQFSVVGHLDYIPRYSPYGDYDYNRYRDIIDRILKQVIETGKGIEINTSGYRTEERMYPKIEVLKRYIELGGTMITLGSDAHRTSELGRNFDRVKEDIQAIFK